MKSLEETIVGMCSLDHKDRLKAEYEQLAIRYKKLGDMLEKHEKGELDFKPACPVKILEHQLDVMSMYRAVLELRCKYEGVDTSHIEW